MSGTNKKCIHYLNKCTFYAECCNKYYDCKRCHTDNELSHTINITKIKCDDCNIEQEFGQICINCNISFGKYCCKVCHILDNQDRNIVHCDQCSICRVGTRESLFHCQICGCCFNIASQKSHKCHK